MSTLSAALLSFQLGMVDSLMLSRCEIAGKYKDALKDCEVKSLTCVYPSYNGHKYVIRSASRDKIQEMLRQNGVSTMVHYPIPLFDHPVFHPFRQQNCESWNVYKLCSEVLSLPIFPEMNPIETDRICRLLNTI
jgi:dTDP-4-amino-4,6-dideoxygalactose transaminase